MTATRNIVPELMDDPTLPSSEHDAALRGLARLNTISFAHRALCGIAMRATRGLEHVTLLDVAAGSGDVSLAVARRLQAAGKRVSVTGVDVSGHAALAARARFEAAGIKARFETADALEDPLPTADLVMCTLFLHHLSDREITPLLARLTSATNRVLLINDLRRGRAGLVASMVVPRLVTRSPVVHVDAVRSYRAALPADELRGFAKDAGLANARVRHAFPYRMTLEWHSDAVAGSAS